MTVTIRFTAPIVEAMPAISRPMAKSMPWLGLKIGWCSARRRTTAVRRPPRSQGLRKSPPNRNTQNERAFIRGKATSRAPDWSGIRYAMNARRHDHEEHHRDAVHREGLVVEVGRDELAVRLGQLDPDEQRLDAADEEEHQRGRAVHDADLLVVDAEQPRLPAAGDVGAGRRRPGTPRRRGVRRRRGGRGDRSGGSRRWPSASCLVGRGGRAVGAGRHRPRVIR